MATEMVCGECGARNVAGEDFCGACGTYLEWESVPVTVEQPVVDAATEAAPAVEPPKSVIERVKAVVGRTDESARAAPRVELAPEAEQAAADQAAARTAKPEQPLVARLPGAAAPKPRRRPVVADDQPIQQGDLICGNCGAGNKPTRKFCRRCGKPLAEAETARIPWWRRLFAKSRRTGRPAGSRPKAEKKRRVPPLTKYVVLLLVLAGLVSLAWPWMTKGYEAVVDRIFVAKVNPDSFGASSEESGHPPGSIRDGDTKAYWAPKKTDRARGQWVEVRFDPPIRLVRVLVKVGVGTEEASFLKSSWPTELGVTMFTTDGGKIDAEISLDDTAASQERALVGSDVERVRFRILKVHRGSGDSPVAIGEIEFFRRR